MTFCIRLLNPKLSKVILVFKKAGLLIYCAVESSHTKMFQRKKGNGVMFIS